MKPPQEIAYSNTIGVYVEGNTDATVPKNTFSPTLDRIFRQKPPQMLYHYTSPAGLIGIICNKCVWATNIRHLNDPIEIEFAVDYARFVLEDHLNEKSLKVEEQELIKAFYTKIGSAFMNTYVFSLSEKGDLLSQWRAYCQPGGGYAIGFPSAQLETMASVQEFRLWPCIYGSTASIIVSEMIESFVKCYHKRIKSGIDPIEARENTARQFAQHLAYFGPAMKQDAFEEEKEWRLVGTIKSDHSQLSFRPGKNGIIPYFNFLLVDVNNPDLVDENGQGVRVVSGPGIDQFPLQQFLAKKLPSASRSSSRAHYRWKK